jgi:hypothetical protein
MCPGSANKELEELRADVERLRAELLAASHRLEKAFTFGGKDHSLTFKFIQVRK